MNETRPVTDSENSAPSIGAQTTQQMPAEPAPNDHGLVTVVRHDAFLDAAKRSGVTPEVAEAIWGEIAPASPPRTERGTGLRRERESFAQTTRLSRAVKVLLYLGALLVIGSYGWWADQLHVGMRGLLALSIIYCAGFLVAALWAQMRGLDELATAAALVVAFYVPVIVYASLRLTGFDFGFHEQDVSAFYEWISAGWIWLELAGIVGAVALYVRFRAPLLALPLLLFTVFLAEDGTARAVGLDQDSSNLAIGSFVIVFAGLAVAGGVLLDYRGLRRHALWPHTLGAAGIVVGLEFLLAEHSYQLALILSGGAFLLLGVWLGRVGYLIAGGLALWIGITALEPSPAILTVSGLALVGAAVWLSLSSSPLRRWLQARTLPAPQRD